jgi:hypothetical protein
MNSNDLKFTLNYVISLVIVLVICIYLMKSAPTLHPVLIVVIGLLVAYLVVSGVNFVFPTFTNTSENISQYVEYSLYSNFNDLGYLNLWPPLFAVLIIFIILLYNGQIRFGNNVTNVNIRK